MEFLLKQRLVGAIVLVALGVIFIPMFLEGPNRNLVPEMEPLPEPHERKAIQPLSGFPAPDGIPEEPDSQIIHSESVAAADADKVPVPDKPVVTADAPKETPLALPSQPEPAPPPEPAPVEEAPTVAPKATAALGNWVVQVGSFSSEQNALKLRDKLRAGGFATQVEKVVLADKAHYRVRVGPYLKRTQADGDLKKLAKQFDLKGRVLAYP